jgi:hypothetical protein
MSSINYDPRAAAKTLRPKILLILGVAPLQPSTADATRYVDIAVLIQSVAHERRFDLVNLCHREGSFSQGYVQACSSPSDNGLAAESPRRGPRS